MYEMCSVIAYHGTADPESVLAGIRFDTPRRADPGDFGWGFYCTEEGSGHAPTVSCLPSR